MKLIGSIVACAVLSTEAESACLSTDHPDDCAGLAAIAASMHSDKWVKNTHCERHTVSLLSTTLIVRLAVSQGWTASTVYACGTVSRATPLGV